MCYKSAVVVAAKEGVKCLPDHWAQCSHKNFFASQSTREAIHECEPALQCKPTIYMPPQVSATLGKKSEQRYGYQQREERHPFTPSSDWCNACLASRWTVRQLTIQDSGYKIEGSHARRFPFVDLVPCNESV